MYLQLMKTTRRENFYTKFTKYIRRKMPKLCDNSSWQTSASNIFIVLDIFTARFEIPGLPWWLRW